MVTLAAVTAVVAAGARLALVRRDRARRAASRPIANRYARPPWADLDQVQRF